MKKKLFVFFSFVVTIVMLCPILTFAHSGGHYHHGDATLYNTWQLKNGNSLKGNFLMNKSDMIYLEKEDGKLLAVPIQDLSIQDQKLANFKINKLNGIKPYIVDILFIFVVKLKLKLKSNEKHYQIIRNGWYLINDCINWM